MAQLINGPGVGLPPPQNLYPTALQNAPIDPSSNKIALNAGDQIVIPAGDWFIDTGSYCILQFLDPVNGTWRAMPSAAWNGGFQFVKSDGFNVRIANLTGCVYNIVPTAYGSGYVQASTSLTITGPSGVTASPIVGGQLAQVSLVAAGAGFTMPPIVFIPPPPPSTNNSNGVGGIQASAYANIANGTVSSISFTNAGAGYPTAPGIVLLPNPADPCNITGFTQASVNVSLVGSGSITGALITNNGAPIPDNSLSNVTVTVAGVGSGATLAADVMQTVKAVSVVGAGTGYGTLALGVASAGGAGSTGTVQQSPEFLRLNFRPRPVQASLAVVGVGSVAAQVGTILDGGLFLSAPNVVLQFNTAPGATLLPTGSTISFIMGSRPDIVTMQPAP